MPVTQQSNPLQELHVDRSEVKCQRCQSVFAHFVFEEIEDLVQLRCGDVLVTRAEMVCMRCGWVFHWDVRSKFLEKMAVAYGELTVMIKRYVPE